MREIEANAAAQEAIALREHISKLWDSQKNPPGIAWIDAFNGLLRSVFVSLLMILFAAQGRMHP